MRYLILISIMFILNSCKKETLKNDENYQYFIGKWENNPSSGQEKILVEFQKHGKIIIKKGLERNDKFVPQYSSHKIADFSTNGKFWDIYTFSIKEFGAGKAIRSSMNPTKDTITFPIVVINDFVYENLSTTFLTKQ